MDTEEKDASNLHEKKLSTLSEHHDSGRVGMTDFTEKFNLKLRRKLVSSDWPG
jgi:hypothetical protein